MPFFFVRVQSGDVIQPEQFSEMVALGDRLEERVTALEASRPGVPVEITGTSPLVATESATLIVTGSGFSVPTNLNTIVIAGQPVTSGVRGTATELKFNVPEIPDLPSEGAFQPLIVRNREGMVAIRQIKVHPAT